MAERMLLANARVLTCSGDPAEQPFDGDVLIEGNRIAKVTTAGSTWTRPGRGWSTCTGPPCCPGSGDAHTHISWPLDFVFDHAAVAAAPARPAHARRRRRDQDVPGERLHAHHRRRGDPAAGRPAREGRDRPGADRRARASCPAAR